MAVAYDTVGAAAHVNASTMSWSHTLGASATAIIVPIATGTNGYSPVSGWTRSVTCGGTAMTNLGSQSVNNQSGYPYLDLWVLISPGTGAKTISVSYTKSGSTPYLVGQSISYTGVGSVSTTFSYGNSSTLSTGAITSATGNMVCGFMHCWANTGTPTLSSPNGTSRYAYAGASNTYPSLIIQDMAGAATDTLTCSASANYFWDCAGVNLIAGSPSGGTPTNQFFTMF